ncbi:MAG: hypothetical protein IJC73_08575, partial [Lentisphaeria bacterium]|nr:hypothetical protein [Lentisphaeria bacterium]
MADYYVLYNGIQYEVADAAAGVAKAKELGSSAILYFNGGAMDYMWNNENVSAVMQNGAYVRVFYLGTKTDAVNAGDITFTLDGGTVNCIYGGAGGTAGAGTIGNVTINLLSGRMNNAGGVCGTGYNESVTQGLFTLNIDGYVQPDGVNQIQYAMAKSAPSAAVINMKSGATYKLCAGTCVAGVNIVTSTSTINMTGGTVAQIMGGNNVASSLTGDIHINVSGGTIWNSFYGAAGTAQSELIGNAYINISGGYFSNAGGSNYFAGGYQGAHTGDVITTISGGTIAGRFCNGSIKNIGPGNKVVAREGNLTLTYTGGQIDHYIYGGNYSGTVNGNITVNLEGVTYNGANSGVWAGNYGGEIYGNTLLSVKNSQVYLLYGGGYSVGSDIHGDVTIEVTGSTVTGVVQAGGSTSGMEGGVTTVTITDSYLDARSRRSDWSLSGWVIGGSNRNTADVAQKKTNVTITNSTVEGVIVAGSYHAYSHFGDIALTISGSTIGYAGQTTGGDGTIYLTGFVSYQESNITATITDTVSYAGFYASGRGAAEEESELIGNISVSISDSSFNGGIFAGDYGGVQYDENAQITGGYQLTVTGSVAIALDNVTAAKVSGKGYHDLCTITGGAILAVSGKLTVSGSVADFASITIAAGATIEAGAVVAAAITAAASAEDGAYLLATGFAAQDSVITVVNASGSTIGTVTLSEAVTCGSFSVGSDAYTVAISGDNLYLTKNADVPAPPAPPIEPPVVESKFTAEVVLTITDTTHAYFGATGAWKVLDDQKIVWQDLSTLS